MLVELIKPLIVRGRVVPAGRSLEVDDAVGETWIGRGDAHAVSTLKTSPEPAEEPVAPPAQAVLVPVVYEHHTPHVSRDPDQSPPAAAPQHSPVMTVPAAPPVTVAPPTVVKTIPPPPVNKKKGRR